MSVGKSGAVVILAVVLFTGSLAAADSASAGGWGLFNSPKTGEAKVAEPDAPTKAELAPTKAELAPTKAELAPTKAELAPTKVEQSEDPVNNDYILGPGDQLDISVWKDDALTRSLAVLPDGKIHFPLVGELVATGKTVSQLKKELVVKLIPFLTEPILSIDVKQVNSQIIYVIGRVNTPGRLMLNANINVLQALAMAGGFNPFADKGNVKIIRYEGEKTQVFKFDYDKVVKKETPEMNFGLKRGDVIVVP